MARPQTLCWDCRNATEKDCEWARYFKPVPGWEAEKTKMKTGEASYIVYDCPRFVRDSWRAGEFRTKEEYDDAEIKREKNRINNEENKRKRLEQAKKVIHENGLKITGEDDD